jgi:hypothetical protein
MNEITVKLIKGAISGFAAAFVVDVAAWSKTDGLAFDWKVAGKRWFSGLVSGAFAALGMGGVQ